MLSRAQWIQSSPWLWVSLTGLILVGLSWRAYRLFEQLNPDGFYYLALGGVWLLLTAPAIPFATRLPATWQWQLSTGRRLWAGLGLMLGAIAALAFSIYLFASRSGFDAPKGLYMMNIGQAPWTFYFLGLALLALGGLTLWRGPQTTPARQPHPWVIGVVILVAALLRLYDLAEYPMGIWTDESLNAVWAQEMGQFSFFRPVFLPIANTTGPHLFIYYGALELFGEHSIQGPRLVTAFVGVAGVWMLYLLGSELHGRWFGVGMALCVTSVAWALNFSRIAMTGIESVLLIAWILYHLLRWLRLGLGREALLLALALGVSLWFYQALRPLIGLIGLWMFLACLRRFSWQGWSMLVGTGLVLLVILAPWLIFEQRNPGVLNQRTQDLLITNPGPRSGLDFEAALRYNLGRYSRAFHITGDDNPRHNYDDRPLLDPLQGSLLMLGLVLALRYWRHTEIWLLLLLSMANIGVAVFTYIQESPNSIRMLPALALGTYFITLPAYSIGLKLWGVWPRRWSAWAGLGATALVLVLVGWQVHFHATRYFGLWRADHQTSEAFASEITLVGKLIAQEPPNTLLYHRFYFWHSQVIFVWPQFYRQVYELQLPNRFPLTIQPQPVAIWIPTWDADLLASFRQFYPTAELRPIRLSDYGLHDDPANPILFYWARLTSHDIAAHQGLDAAGQGALYISEPGQYEFQWPVDAELRLNGQVIEPGQVLRLIPGFQRLEYSGDWRTTLQWRWVHRGNTVWEGIPPYVLYDQIEISNGVRGRTYLGAEGRGPLRSEAIFPFIGSAVSAPHGDHYHNEWQGFIELAEGGWYRFWPSTDSYTEVWINGRRVALAQDGQLRTDWIELQAGRQRLVVIQRDRIPRDDLDLLWQPLRPDRATLVPQSVLRPY